MQWFVILRNYLDSRLDMAKHNCKRKMLKYRLKKASIAIIGCAFLFLFGLWRIVDNFQYDTQVAFRTEEILSVLGSRNCVELMKPEEDTTIIKGEINIHVNGVKDYYLIVLVSSLPSNKFRRNIIRSTWAREEHSKETIVRFFMGRPQNPEEKEIIQMESKLHGDIIVDDFEEHYYRLTLKSLKMLKWFLQNKTPDTQFVAKTDDDVYVNITNAISYLKHNISTSEYSSFIGGDLYLKSRIEKDPYSKWYVPRQLMIRDHEEIFPLFVGGPFYLMHAEVAAKLIEKCQDVPMFHLEDVYISGLLGSSLNIIPKYIPNVYCTIPKAYWQTVHYNYVRYILVTKSIIAYHTYSMTELIEIIYTSSTT